MALTIYGSPRSRTMRVLWMAMELGLEYTHVPLAFDDPRLKEPDFLRINPAGAVPALMDDGFVLAESLAINLYLAKKYGTAGRRPSIPVRSRARLKSGVGACGFRAISSRGSSAMRCWRDCARPAIMRRRR